MKQDKKECKHQSGKPRWDYWECNACGWIQPSGVVRGPNKGFFPSMDAVTEFDKFKYYPGMDEIKPLIN